MLALTYLSCTEPVNLGMVQEPDEKQFMALLAGSWEGEAEVLVVAHTLTLPLQVAFSPGGYAAICDSGATPPTVPCVTFAPSGTFESFRAISTGSAFAEAKEAIWIDGTYIQDATVTLGMSLLDADTLEIRRTWKARTKPFADYGASQAVSFLELLFGDLGPAAEPPAETPPGLDDVVSSLANVTLKRVPSP